GTLAFSIEQKCYLSRNAAHPPSNAVKHAQMLCVVAKNQETAGIHFPGQLTPSEAEAELEQALAREKTTYQWAMERLARFVSPGAETTPLEKQSCEVGGTCAENAKLGDDTTEVRKAGTNPATRPLSSAGLTELERLASGPGAKFRLKKSPLLKEG